jgi:hypothetical protein
MGIVCHVQHVQLHLQMQRLHKVDVVDPQTERVHTLVTLDLLLQVLAHQSVVHVTLGSTSTQMGLAHLVPPELIQVEQMQHIARNGQFVALITM